MLVTLEGLDGSGKTTAWEALHERYPRGIFTREPTESWYGDAVRRSIDDPDADPMAELFLYCADHAAHLSQTIRPALGRDSLVVSDRYLDSRIAYQGVTLRETLDDPVDFIKALHAPFSRTPDLTCYLEVDIDVAVERSGETTKFEHRAFLEAVDKIYRQLIADEPNRFVRIDAEADAADVVDAIVDAIERRSP